MTQAKTQSQPKRSAAELNNIRRELTQPRARAARYARDANAVVVELQNGVILTIPTQLIEGVSGANPDLIARMEMDKRGLVLNWEELGAGLTIPDLWAGCFGSSQWMEELRARGQAVAAPTASEMGRKGGSASTRAKRESSRANGKLGGRPRKKVVA
jgi:hypothetical protein